MTVKVSQLSVVAATFDHAASDTDVLVSAAYMEVWMNKPPLGQLRLNGVALSHPVYDDATVIVEQSDRAAFDVHTNPEKHASDIYAGEPTVHAPWPAAAGFIAVSDGDKWVAQELDAAPVDHGHIILTLGSREGDLEVGASPLKVYNKYGSTRTITKVFLSVGTAPVGADIVVQVYLDGVAIFDAGDEPTIVDASSTGESVTFLDDQWLNGSYLTWEITNVGSSTAGANLVVHIISE